MQLVSIGKGFSLNPVAASAFLAALAERPGLLSRINDADRSLADQIRIFTTRYTTDRAERLHWPLDRRVWQGRSWYRRAGYAMAAVPETSHHGPPWSSALDIETGNADFTWWLHNAKRFNFYQPTWAIGVESWHWEHNGHALDAPQAPVLEAPTSITTKHQEEHMFLVRAKGDNAVYIFSECKGTLTHVPSQKDLGALLQANPTLKVRVLDVADFARLRQLGAAMQATHNAAGFDYVRVEGSSKVYAVYVPTGRMVPIESEADAKTLQATAAWSARVIRQDEWDLLVKFGGADPAASQV